MERAEQMRIVSEVLTGVEQHILGNIADGNVPAEWDGIELRRYLVDVAERKSPRMDRKRYHEYRNEVLIRNL